MADQTSETIVRLLVDNNVCRHGVPADRPWSEFALIPYKRGVQPTQDNITIGHPQRDGLV